MKLKTFTSLTAVLAASAVLVPAASQAAPTPPPATTQVIETATFDFSGQYGVTTAFDKAASIISENGATYSLSSIVLSWTTTALTSDGFLTNLNTTSSFTLQAISGSNSFSLLSGEPGAGTPLVFSTDISAWNVSGLNVTAPAAITTPFFNPGGAFVPTFNTGVASSVTSLTSANGSLFNWFVGTGTTQLTLSNTNSAISTTPPLGTNQQLLSLLNQEAAGTLTATYNYSLSGVPEASSLVMGSFGILGLAGAGFLRRRRATAPTETEGVEDATDVESI